MHSVTCSDVCVVNLGINADNEMRGIKINMPFSSIKYYQNNLRNILYLTIELHDFEYKSSNC